MYVLAFVSENYVTIVSTVIGIVASWIIARRSQSRAELTVTFEEFSPISSNSITSHHLSIFFKDKRIDRLSRTRFYIWNSGNQTIDGSDIVTSEPIRLSVTDNRWKILSVEVALTSRDVCGIKFSSTDSEDLHIVKFEFLDPNDGLIIDAYHDGDHNSIKIFGTVKGSRVSLEHRNHPKPPYKTGESYAEVFILFFLSITSVFLLVLYIRFEFYRFILTAENSFQFGVIITLVFFILTVCGLIYLTSLSYRQLWRLEPRSLRANLIDRKQAK